MLYGIGAAMGPLVAALFMWLLGTQGLFIFIMTTAFIFTGALWHWYERIRDMHQTHFMAVPRTTPLAPELDPRSEEDEEYAGATIDSDDADNDTVQDIKI
ncbi:MAG: hypothetical protein U5P41_05225 [Gammaproteobacteria bacterium]|nr:hypothetical protein [Gammaproteobacteria bacterium]